MNPIDAKVGGQQEHGHTERAVRPRSVPFQNGSLEPGRTIIPNMVVHQGLTPDLCYEPWDDERRNDRHRFERHIDLHPDLILEEPRVVF